jgi:hypothetical protein
MLGNGPLAWDEQRMSWSTRFADCKVVTELRTDERAPTCWLGTAPPKSAVLPRKFREPHPVVGRQQGHQLEARLAAGAGA